MNEVSIKPLMDNVQKYITKTKHLDFIQDAYNYAYKMHEGQFRKSGLPYIIHPIDVALTLSEYQTDPVTIVSGLLHDVVEDTNTTYDDIKELFGEEVADIVEGVTKLKKYKYKESKAQEQAKNYQKMLLAMSKDIRVIIVKLADRLNNIRTLDVLTEKKQKRIAKETIEIYSPIAHRLGMYRLKAELEDSSFKYLYPEKYKEIAKLIADTKENRDSDLKMMRTNLEYLLEQDNFCYQVSGRVKNIYSVYNKMINRHKDFEDIYDLLALRIIVNDLSDCYRAIGIIHAKWIPIPNRFKDYIAMPKPNLYQSLHTSVVSSGKIYEIQIRTKEMDLIAEYGVAAHWAYKENSAQSSRKMTDVVISKLKWYGDLIKFSQESENDDDLLNLLREDILQSNVYVFTPDGDIIDLPKGSTPLDFAFRIHTQVGIKTIGAIVNNKIVPLDYSLKTGDIVEIKTSVNSFGPNDNWLKIVKTSNARSKIKSFLNRQRRDILVETGKSELTKEINSRREDIQINDKIVKELFETRGVKSVEDLHYEIGKNTISSGNAVNILLGEIKYTEQQLIDQINKKPLRVKYTESNILVEGVENTSVKLSNCCSPIPGDEILGYISKGTGIAVHRKECNNLKNLDDNRFIDVFWGDDKSKTYNVDIRIVVHNKDNILADIINTVTSSKGKLTQVTASTNKVNEGLIKLKLDLSNLVELEKIIVNLQKMKDVYSIERLCN